MLSDNYDFHIIGASFGGTTIAADLLKHGKTVILADFEKPGSRLKCAGGIEMKAFKRAGLDIPYKRCTSGIISLNEELYEKEVDYAVVDRRELDRASLEKAISMGAKFAKAKYLSHNSRNKSAVFRVNGKEEIIKYKNLILANGFNNKGKNLFLEPYSVAKAEIIKGVSPFPDSLLFIFESRELNGYYWIFPMPDGKINIGAGSVTNFSAIDKKFKKFKEKYKLNGEVIAKGGGIIPLYPVLFPQQDSVIRFGNSAGMVQPITGEGLKYISRISQKFAEAIANKSSVNIAWLLSEEFIKIALATLIIRSCFLCGNSGMSLYLALAKFATNFAGWRKINKRFF